MDLLDYAKTLADAGFEVWHTPASFAGSGYLTYHNPENDCWGTFQYSLYDGWQHLMPIKPSRENGSSMFIGNPEDPWTLLAALQCARPYNKNDLVGIQANHKAWLSPKAVAIHSA